MPIMKNNKHELFAHPDYNVQDGATVTENPDGSVSFVLSRRAAGRPSSMTSFMRTRLRRWIKAS